MQYSKQQLQEAFIKAHEAGDTEAASHLAGVLREYKEPEKEPKKEYAITEDPDFGDLSATKDMSGFQKYAAGFGKAITDTGRGIGNLIGVTSKEDIQDANRRDRDLMSTGAGLAGNISGHVATALAPGGVLKGAALLPKALGASRTANALTKVGGGILNPTTLRGAGATGATYGYIQPGEGDGFADKSRAFNAIMGGVGGAGGLGLGKLAAATWRGGAGLVTPLTEKGRERLAAKMIDDVLGESKDQVLASARAGGEIVEGSKPTFAEVAKHPSISGMQRTLANKSDEFNTSLTQRHEANNAARMNQLNSLYDDIDIAGSEASKRALNTTMRPAIRKSTEEVDTGRTVGAINKILNSASGQSDEIASTLGGIKNKLILDNPPTVRAEAAWSKFNDIIKNPPNGSINNRWTFEALEESRRILGAIKTGKSDDIGAAVKALKEMKVKAKNNRVSGMIDDAIKDLTSKKPRYQTNPEQLYGIRKDIASKLNKKNPDGTSIDRETRRHLTVILKQIDHQIGKKVPEYSQYMKKYSELSNAANQQAILDKIMKKVVTATDDITGTKVLKNEPLGAAIRDIDEIAQRATHFKKANAERILGADKIAKLQSISDDLNRQVKTAGHGKAVGSNTFQNMSSNNAFDQALNSAGIPKWLQGIMGTPARWAMNKVYSSQDEKIVNILAEAMLDPEKAAYLMQLPPIKTMVNRGILSAPSRAALTSPAHAASGLIGNQNQ
jgi:hypothetical protein